MSDSDERARRPVRQRAKTLLDVDRRLDGIMDDVQPIIEVLGAVSSPVNVAKSQLRKVISRG